MFVRHLCRKEIMCSVVDFQRTFSTLCTHDPWPRVITGEWIEYDVYFFTCYDPMYTLAHPPNSKLQSKYICLFIKCWTVGFSEKISANKCLMCHLMLLVSMSFIIHMTWQIHTGLQNSERPKRKFGRNTETETSTLK